MDDGEVRNSLAGLAGWKVEDGAIAKEFRFDTYKDGIVFASAVGFLADRLNHHPDLLVGYGRVKVTLSTHAVQGLSPFDFELARRIESL